MKNKTIIMSIAGILMLAALLYGFATSGNHEYSISKIHRSVITGNHEFAIAKNVCPLEGTAECPKNNCPLAGTPDCPFENGNARSCCQKKSAQ